MKAEMTSAAPNTAKAWPAAADQTLQIRIDLAAAYRLIHRLGLDDSIYTHISARLPGRQDRFLINPYGLRFEEVTASNLVTVDLDGNVVDDPMGLGINPAGFTIHSAIHAARHDAICVLHTHTVAGIAIACQKQGLLPLNQWSLQFTDSLAYHDYEGIALDLDERSRLVNDLGDKALMLLRNHGTLAVGATAAEAWLGIFFLERACKQQVMALAAGRQGVLLAPEQAQETVRGQASAASFGKLALLAWPGLLRKLDRHLPGYDA